MELNPIESTKTKLVLEIAGEDHTLCNPIRKELWNDKTVKVAGYNIEHPLVSNPVLIIEATDAKKSLLAAIERLKKQNKDFLTKFKALK